MTPLTLLRITPELATALSDRTRFQEISDQEDEVDQNSFMCEAW